MGSKYESRKEAFNPTTKGKKITLDLKEEGSNPTTEGKKITLDLKEEGSNPTMEGKKITLDLKEEGHDQMDSNEGKGDDRHKGYEERIDHSSKEKGRFSPEKEGENI